MQTALLSFRVGVRSRALFIACISTPDRPTEEGDDEEGNVDGAIIRLIHNSTPDGSATVAKSSAADESMTGRKSSSKGGVREHSFSKELLL